MITKDIYAEITEKVIEQMEAGTMPWKRPWVADKSQNHFPTNYISNKPYRGINVMILWCSDYADQRFATYKQWASKGGQVRRGESGTKIVLYKPMTVQDKATAKDKDILMMRSYTVFNIAQVDGIEQKQVQSDFIEDTMKFDRALEFESLATYHHGGNRAFYQILTDEIHMPPRIQFKCEEDYHATALHELTHWTGPKDRCNREFGKRFGDDAYAFEELVAEMGAAFLCAHAGIEYQTQHASYVSAWLNIMKGDKKSIITAASQAQKAVDFVLKSIDKNIEVIEDDEMETV